MIKFAVIIFTLIFISCVLSYNWNDDNNILEWGGYHDRKFDAGNFLITDPNSWEPYQIYEFTPQGDNVHNYSTVLNGSDPYTVIPIDLQFLDSDTLLILDLERGVFNSDHKGSIYGIWNGLATHSSKLGCDLEKLNVDTKNSRIYITSRNVDCDSSATVGVFVYDLGGNHQVTILNDEFNVTLGVAGDSSGNIWIPDVNQIFVYIYKDQSFKTYNPINNGERLAYNGILITDDDEVYIAVPAYYHDLIVELDLFGNIKQKIELSGNTSTDGKTSGYPSTMVMIGNTLVVEVPYASKHEAPGDSDVIQFYDTDGGSLQSSFGGHSCKAKNILCVPYYGMVIVPSS